MCGEPERSLFMTKTPSWTPTYLGIHCRSVNWNPLRHSTLGCVLPRLLTYATDTFAGVWWAPGCLTLATASPLVRGILLPGDCSWADLWTSMCHKAPAAVAHLFIYAFV